MRRPTSTSDDGVQYRDLNGNGVMDPYEDSRLDSASRAKDLLERLSIEEKVGLLFNTVMVVGEPGDHDAASPFGPETPRDFVVGQSINHFNIGRFPSAEHMARWQNGMQELAELAPPTGFPSPLPPIPPAMDSRRTMEWSSQPARFHSGPSHGPRSHR